MYLAHRVSLLVFAICAQIPIASPVPPVPLHIEVTQPAYSGEPVWVTATSGPVQNVQYPFHAAMEDVGCNRIELKHNGVALSPLSIRSTANLSGILCGSAAPSGSPRYRLPLHALFDISTPGSYSVRWTELSSKAVSDWVDFEVLKSTPEQQERWLSTLLAQPPDSPGLLAGDLLPSLLAGAPDPRVLKAFVNYLHDENPMVSGMAAAGLEHFALSEVRPAVVDSVVHNGPSEAIAFFATYHSGWTESEEDRVVHATAGYLGDSPHPSQRAAAFTLLHFIFDVPNHAWPLDPGLKAYADAEVLGSAPRVIASGDARVIHELAEYLGSMSSPRAHDLLQRIAERTDGSAEQARIALTWHPQSADLPRLAALLITAGDPDPRGTDRSNLPYSLVKGYGDAALPYLEKAVSSSPYVWVRTQSAEQLALHGRSAGFRFLLEAIEGSPPYRTAMIRWVQSSFSNVLPPNASDQQVRAFLRSRISTER